MWKPEIVAMVVGAFLLAGFIKGVIGMGLPVVAPAFLGSTLGVCEALTIMLIPVIGGLLVLAGFWLLVSRHRQGWKLQTPVEHPAPFEKT